MDCKINHKTAIIRRVALALVCGLSLVSCSDVMNDMTDGTAADMDKDFESVPIRIHSGMVEASVTKARVLSTTSLDNMALFMFAEKDHYPIDLGNYAWCSSAGDGLPAVPELSTAPRYNEPISLSGGEFVWPDGQTRYYPTGGPYEYSFTCVSPRIDNDKYIAGEDTIQHVDTLETLSHVVVHYAIDGRQDIIWGACHGTDTLQWCANYYRYHRVEDGMGGYTFDAETQDPVLTLHHLLAAFSFNIECTGSDEDLAGLVIDSMTVDDTPYRLMLHVGEKGKTFMRDSILVPDSTQSKYYKKDLPLLTEEGDTVGMDILAHGSQKSGAMMLYPSEEYKISLYMHHEGEEHIDDAPSDAEGVDLGLPSGTKWANMNIGAEKPEESGLFFAWGDTEGYDSDTSDGHDFSINSYKWGASYHSMQKYCNNSNYGTVDGKTTLDAEDDAAAVIWRGDWRMPTREEIQELCNNNYTTSEWTTVNGVYGRCFTSKTNGNSIFLPAAGYRRDAELYGHGSYGNYWSSSLSTIGSDRACYLYFNLGSGYWSNNAYRDGGHCVRAVLPSTSDREERRGWKQRVTRTLTLGGGNSFKAGHHYTVDIHVSGTRFESETEEDQ
jgi:hypothetical protein